jgi:uncharacterized protein (TIGR02265 family)
MFGAPDKEPATIKGMFVNSHVEALRKKSGERAVEELERRFGRPIRFDRFAAVPIRDEVAILEHSLDLMNQGALTGRERALAAGGLHFTNFTETPLGHFLMTSLPRTAGSFRSILHNTPSIARVVFAHTTFRCEEYEQKLVITISNCDYPLEHFQGFFEEWMRYWGLQESRAAGRAMGEGIVEYRLSFSEKLRESS